MDRDGERLSYVPMSSANNSMQIFNIYCVFKCKVCIPYRTTYIPREFGYGGAALTVPCR